MTMLLIGGMLASCNKEQITPNEPSNALVGEWDLTNDVDNPYAEDINDGVADFVIYDEETGHMYTGGNNGDFTYYVAEDPFYEGEGVKIVMTIGSDMSVETFSQTDDNTIIIGDDIYTKL